MSREVRRVPMEWEHPKNHLGEYEPLYDGTYREALAEYHAGLSKWLEGFRSDWNGGWEAHDQPRTEDAWEEWQGQRPDSGCYMPEFPEGSAVGWQMYETTSEGTPISPVMETPEALADWLAENGASAFGRETASREQWMKTIETGSAVSAVFDLQHGLRSGVAALAEDTQ